VFGGVNLAFSNTNMFDLNYFSCVEQRSPLVFGFHC
jgi:hypothetical protein